MEFWFSGEIDARAAESYRATWQAIETRLNSELGRNEYGPALEKLGFIPMLLGSEYLEGRPERRLIKRKERVADYRLIIDFNAWQAGTEQDRKILLLKNVVETIRDIGRKLRSGFDANRLEQDIVRLYPEIANHSFNGDVAKATLR